MGKNILIILLLILNFTGCTFIVKDEDKLEYYGPNREEDVQYMNRVLEKQQEIYQLIDQENKKP